MAKACFLQFYFLLFYFLLDNEFTIKQNTFTYIFFVSIFLHLKVFIMKKLSFVTAMSLLSAMTLPSYASTATNTFNTDITLTSACVIDSATAVTFTYTSFQTAASTATPSDISVRCTNALPYSMALDTGGSYTDQSTALAYTLAITGGGSGKIGSGIAQSYVVTGNMAANQSGTCADASCSNTASNNKLRTLTITY